MYHIVENIQKGIWLQDSDTYLVWVSADQPVCANKANYYTISLFSYFSLLDESPQLKASYRRKNEALKLQECESAMVENAWQQEQEARDHISNLKRIECIQGYKLWKFTSSE